MSLFGGAPEEPVADEPVEDAPADLDPAQSLASAQRASGVQGRQFAEQCDQLLTSMGYTLEGKQLVKDIGVEIDQVAVSKRTGVTYWFEYKGSIQGSRPGLMRTDTLKKAIANGALIAGMDERQPYIVLTSHSPMAGSGLAMMQTALRLGYLTDAICLYNPEQLKRLQKL